MNEKKLRRLKAEGEAMTIQYACPSAPHLHEKWELAVFQEGIATNFVNGKKYEARPGDIFLLSRNCLHAICLNTSPHLHQDVYYEEEEVASSVAGLPGSLGPEILSGERVLRIHPDLNAFLAIQSFLSVLRKFAIEETSGHGERDPKIAKTLSCSLLHFVLGLYVHSIYSEQKSDPQWLVELLMEMERPEVFSKKVGDIVAMTNYSHSQVSATFKAYKGVTLVDYLIQIRMNYAKSMLEGSHDSILSISQSCGYTSLSSFIKLFHDYTGSTPLQYRKRAKAEIAKNKILIKK